MNARLLQYENCSDRHVVSYRNVGVVLDIIHGRNFTFYSLPGVFGNHLVLRSKRYTGHEGGVFGVMKVEETDEVVTSRYPVSPMR